MTWNLMLGVSVAASASGCLFECGNDLADAHVAGAIGDGKWLPEFLPKDAKNIREIHNLDTNEILLVFEFGKLTEIVGTCAGNALPPMVARQLVGRRQRAGLPI